ncbi:MAG: hypothetical protein ACOC8J_03630, partial [Ralstonia sp.]
MQPPPASGASGERLDRPGLRIKRAITAKITADLQKRSRSPGTVPASNEAAATIDMQDFGIDVAVAQQKGDG